jgi:hypothetical protein
VSAVQPTALQRLVDFTLLHPRATLNWRSYGFGSEPDNIPAQHTCENDLTVDYRPMHGTLNGLWLRMRYASGGEGSLDHISGGCC